MLETSLPFWLEVVKAIGPLAVAFVAAVVALYIGVKQWRTANDKIVLDLFDRRYALYLEISDSFQNFVNEDTDLPTKGTIRRFRALKDRAQFLFGDDVNAYLNDVHNRMWAVWSGLIDIKRMNPEDRAAAENIYEDLRKIDISTSDFNADLTKLVEPYLKLAHKS